MRFTDVAAPMVTNFYTSFQTGWLKANLGVEFVGKFRNELKEVRTLLAIYF